MPENYLEDFIKAEDSFLYQRVFDSEQKCLVTLNAIPENRLLEDWEFVGPWIQPEIATEIAFGSLNPITLTPLLKKKIPTTKGRLTLPPIIKPITSYFKLKTKADDSLIIFEKSRKVEVQGNDENTGENANNFTFEEKLESSPFFAQYTESAIEVKKNPSTNRSSNYLYSKSIQAMGKTNTTIAANRENVKKFSTFLSQFAYVERKQ